MLYALFTTQNNLVYLGIKNEKGEIRGTRRGISELRKGNPSFMHGRWPVFQEEIALHKTEWMSKAKFLAYIALNPSILDE